MSTTTQTSNAVTNMHTVNTCPQATINIGPSSGTYAIQTGGLVGGTAASTTWTTPSYTYAPIANAVISVGLGLMLDGEDGCMLKLKGVSESDTNNYFHNVSVFKNTKGINIEFQLYGSDTNIIAAIKDYLDSSGEKTFIATVKDTQGKVSILEKFSATFVSMTFKAGPLAEPFSSTGYLTTASIQGNPGLISYVFSSIIDE